MARAPRVSGEAATRRGSAWLRIRAVARRHAYVLPRTPHRLFDLTIWPLVDVVLFGSLAVFVSREGQSLAGGYLLSGIVLWHVVYQSQIAVSTGFLEETWSRNIVNLMVTPLREAEYVLGVGLFGLAKISAGVGVVALTALVFFAFDITDLGLGLIPIVAILLIVGWVISLFVIALVLRFGSGAEALAWGVLFAVMPLSGIFYPVDALPLVLRPIAHSLPTTHAFAAARGIVAGDGILWGEVALGAVTSVGAGLIAMWFLMRMLKRFRQRGYISRYT